MTSYTYFIRTVTEGFEKKKKISMNITYKAIEGKIWKNKKLPYKVIVRFLLLIDNIIGNYKR